MSTKIFGDILTSEDRIGPKPKLSDYLLVLLLLAGIILASSNLLN